VDHRLYREWARIPRGERIYEAVPGKRRERTSIIAAAQNGRLVAPLTFTGTWTTEVVHVYFEKVLLPMRPPGSAIVLDNTRFHQSMTTPHWSRRRVASCCFSQPARPNSIPPNMFGLFQSASAAQLHRHGHRPTRRVRTPPTAELPPQPQADRRFLEAG